MEKHFKLFLAMLMCLFAFSTTAVAANITIMVESEYVRYDQAPIIVNERILVPIRVACEKMGATVTWDGSTQTVFITKRSTTLSLTIGSSVMWVNDGTSVQLDVPPQIHNGSTFAPIRAIVERLGYEVHWDDEGQNVLIEVAGAVMVPNLSSTQPSYTRPWARISSVQQFAYKNEGLAYAYVKENNVEVITPNKTLQFELKYPLLGDVISDDNGNFYIVWGKVNDTDDTSVETVFISKYSPEGANIKTTGFVGESPLGADGNTKIPFDAGNCVSAIGDGYLMVTYARSMYNGHQSNNVIGVKLSDMSPVKWDDIGYIPYTSHSFNQSVIWRESTNGFLYADHGDGYTRGFRFDDGSGKWSYDGNVLFHFYLPPNANHDMFIVNRTFAQLGNLAETSKGVALVGASAKSISEAAKDEKQNLFIQIFDPLGKVPATSQSTLLFLMLNPQFTPQKEFAASTFIGGSTRSGATATDINDNENAPLTEVTDYGVHWLTDYTDMDVVAPQVVTADDRLVILWATETDTFYMVLSASGDVLTPATSLGGMVLNSYERPIYHNGSIYWAATHNGRLWVSSIMI